MTTTETSQELNLIYDDRDGSYYIHYSDTKKMDVKNGSMFDDHGSFFQAVEYVTWLNCQNRQFSGFRCIEL